MAGALKTLFQALQASQYLAGNQVTLLFGGEEVNQQRNPLPCVVMVPNGGRYAAPGYEAAGDPAVEMRWETSEIVDFWLHAASSQAGASGAIDHVDAIEQLRVWFLGALQDQRAQYTDATQVAGGLQYFVEGGRWEVGQNATSRFGRAYVLTVRIPITIALPPPPTATVQTEQFNYSVQRNPS